MPDEFTVIIDTREQKPMLLDKMNDPNYPGLKCEIGTLKTGDYSIKNMDSPDCVHSVCIERKSLSDLFSSTGRGRDRLEREFVRMMDFDFAALVIEADFKTMFENPPELSQMLPKSVFRTVLAFGQRYNVHCFPCSNRSFAEKTTYLLLKRFWDDRQPGGKLDYSTI